VELLRWRLRTAALLGVAALGVHQLRYAIGFGRHGESALGAGAHGYLTVAAPVVLGLLVLGIVEVLLRIGTAEIKPVTVASPRMARTWVTTTALLVAIYGLQEAIEGYAAAGQPAGPGAIYGHGGWVALLLAAVFGGLISLIVRRAAGAIQSASSARARNGRVAPRPSLAPLIRDEPALDAVARFLAARGPPPLST
jgi:hypothetical protein